MSNKHIPHVVMVTHGDRWPYLARTIPALLQTQHAMTLTVVANAPSIETLDCLRDFEAELHELIVSKKNLGYPKAANRGWRARRNPDYTVHVGDDCLSIDTDWLRKLVDIADCCPEVGIVGHSVEPVSYQLRQVGNPLRTIQVQSANLGGVYLVPHRTWKLCGYFNEEMGPYGEEDALYGWKVRQCGLLCGYFDHNILGRSFEHIGTDDDPKYRKWKDERRARALPIREKLKQEYLSGRPLNK